jgi:hypothetical protein
MIIPLTTNPNRDLDRSKDHHRIFPSTECYMYIGKKSQQIKKNNNLRKIVENNIQQSA